LSSHGCPTAAPQAGQRTEKSCFCVSSFIFTDPISYLYLLMLKTHAFYFSAIKEV
jgi:hypothetical protein